jgi:transmembrane sensor
MTDRDDEGEFDWALLARYFSGEATDEERRELEAWIAADPARHSEVVELRRLWQEAGRLPTAARMDALWGNLSRQMRGEAAPTPLPAGHPARRAVPTAIAASLLLALGVGAVWHERQASRPAPAEASRLYQTGRGQTAHLRLADGSQVTLAPESRLLVHPMGATRGMDLVGEAVFRVEHDAAHPFLVYSGESVTEDLGTEFGVRSYPSDAEVRVVVVEGRVALRPTSAPAHSGTILLAGQLGRVDSVGRVAVEDGADHRGYLGWARARLVFHQTTLRDVAVELGRRYDVRVQITDPNVALQRITLDVPAGPISEVLEAITVPLSLQYERSGDLIRLHR